MKEKNACHKHPISNNNVWHSFSKLHFGYIEFWQKRRLIKNYLNTFFFTVKLCELDTTRSCRSYIIIIPFNIITRYFCFYLICSEGGNVVRRLEQNCSWLRDERRARETERPTRFLGIRREPHPNVFRQQCKDERRWLWVNRIKRIFTKPGTCKNIVIMSTDAHSAWNLEALKLYYPRWLMDFTSPRLKINFIMLTTSIYSTNHTALYDLITHKYL